MVTHAVPWNPLSHRDYELMAGKDVFSRDGEKVGFVKEVWHPDAEFPTSHGQHFFLLDADLLKDPFESSDRIYLPESAVDQVTTDHIAVNLTKDEIKRASWNETPAGWDRYRPY